MSEDTCRIAYVITRSDEAGGGTTSGTAVLPSWCTGDPSMAVALYLYGTRDGVEDVRSAEVLAADDDDPPARVRLSLHNVYACGRESSCSRMVRAPHLDEPLDDWWETVVHPLTGDGHSCGASEDAYYEAMVLAADDPMLRAGDSRRWEG